MTADNANRLLVMATVLVAGAGLVDAAISAEWDLFAVFVVVTALAVALALRLSWHRPPIAVRRDLVIWLRDKAALGGEPLQVVTDRALATYRDRYGNVQPDEQAR